MRIYLGLALLASACTGSIGGDDGTGDDTMMPPPTDVQITVRDGTAGRASVRVLFQDTNGGTLKEVPTDANGFATAEMPNGGNLTVIRTYATVPPNPPTPTEVFTYVGVKGGDRLQLGHELDTLSPAGAINVTVPTDAQGTVTVTTACGTGQGAAPNVAMTATSCPADLGFFVEDAGQNAFFARAPYGNSVDLSGQSLVGPLTTTLSASNVMPTMTSVDAEQYIMDGTYMLYASGPKRIDTQPAQVNLPNLHGIDGMLVTTIASATGGQMVATRSAYAVAPTTIDATVGLLPYVSAVKYDTNGITWTETGTGSADFELAIMDVTPKNAVVGYRRIMVAPHTGTSMLPTLFSGADSMYNPSLLDDQIATTYGIIKATGGYDATRARVFAVGSVTQLAPMNGMVTLSYVGNTPPSI